MLSATWTQAVETAFLGLVGLWLAHNYRRQIRLRLAERQVDAYMSLWAVTVVAAPFRTIPLDRVERVRLRGEMNQWYFQHGNGIFMSSPARDIYVAVQSNLTCPIESITPPQPRDRIGRPD